MRKRDASGKKRILSALAASLVAWIVGLYLIDSAVVQDFTDRGPVDMTNALAILNALTDPSFRTEYTWGSFKITGGHWGFTLPLTLALVAFVGTLILCKRRS